jgi:dihydropteroate synthase
LIDKGKNMRALKTKIMGILNVTPDSFYDKGQFFSQDSAIERGIKLFDEGADLIDIGGESTRPGADPVSEQEELERIIPVIEALKSRVTIPISIDTMKPAVARAAIKAGASIINDVSGFRNPEMIKAAAETQARICVMHMLGEPKTMQVDPHYPNGVIEEIILWFKNKAIELGHSGIKKKNIIFDPGIGFGKTVEDNYEILHNLQKFKALGFPILIGLSRKSFIGKVVGMPPQELLAPTIALNTLAMRENVDFIRVHDVKEHRSVADVMEKFLSGQITAVQHV